MKLSKDRFNSVVRDTVLVSLDLLVVNEKEEILLGKRCNSPARGYFFVPGGRIHKGESPVMALARISRDEIGTELRKEDVSLHGTYHHVFPDNFFEDPSIPTTEYVVLACLFRPGPSFVAKPDSQHNDMRFFPIGVLAEHPEVHAYTKDYFRDRASNAFLSADSALLPSFRG